MKKKVAEGPARIWTPKGFGRVVVERKFAFKKRGYQPSKVYLSLGLPVRPPKRSPGDPWVCPMRIRGLRSEFRTHIFGYDSMQAMTLALTLAEVLLPTMAKDNGGTIEFEEVEVPLIFDNWPDFHRFPIKHRRKLIRELNVENRKPGKG